MHRCSNISQDETCVKHPQLKTVQIKHQNLKWSIYQLPCTSWCIVQDNTMQAHILIQGK